MLAISPETMEENYACGVWSTEKVTDKEQNSLE